VISKYIKLETYFNVSNRQPKNLVSINAGVPARDEIPPLPASLLGLSVSPLRGDTATRPISFSHPPRHSDRGKPSFQKRSKASFEG